MTSPGNHLEHLASVLRHTLQSGSEELRAALTALSIEAHERHLRSPQEDQGYFRQLVHELPRIRGSDLAETRVGLLLDASRYFYLVADNLGSIAASKHALDLAQMERLRDSEWRAHRMLGIAYGDALNLSSAMEHYGEAIVIGEELGSIEALGSVADQVGLILGSAGHHSLARECFRFALQKRGEDVGYAHWHASTLMHMAETHYHLEHHDEALRQIREAIAVAPPPTDAHALMAALEREAVYVRILLAREDVVAARQRTDQFARPLASRSESPRAPAKVVLLEALCDVHEKNYDLGITRLTHELEEARKKPTRAVSQAEFLTEIARAYKMAGEPERALNTVREFNEIARRAWQGATLAQHAQHIQRLGVNTSFAANNASSYMQREHVLDVEVKRRLHFQASSEILERFALTAEIREDAEGAHIFRVGKLTALLAAECGYNEDECARLELCARLHDIGKADTKPSLELLQAVEWTPEQRRIMQEHTRAGQRLLEKSAVEGMEIAEDIALCHHERWDGRGYPNGLSGSAIPFSARLVAIADVFDALTHQRRWRAAWSIDQAIQHLRDNAGKHFDPHLVPTAIALIERLRLECTDLDAYLGSASLDSPWTGGLERVRLAMQSSILPMPELSPGVMQGIPKSAVPDVPTPFGMRPRAR